MMLVFKNSYNGNYTLKKKNTPYLFLNTTEGSSSRKLYFGWNTTDEGITEAAWVTVLFHSQSRLMGLASFYSHF